MNKRANLKTVSSMIDELYTHQGFSDWWDTLSSNEEDKIVNRLVEIINEKINIYHK